MKQLLQNIANGETNVADVPSPRAGAGQVLIHTSVTLVSVGTERMLIEFGKANWLDKARQQPDKVRMVLEKARTDGLAATLEAVQSKLDQPLALGYCNVGVVVEIGAGVEGFAMGDRVVSNGKHAEVVCVPKNLCVRVPEPVTDEHAAFTVLGAIGLEGIRLVNPTIGECVVVTGLGLIGLLTVQLLRAQGCRVLGIDLDAARLAMARNFGAEVVDLSRGEDPLALAAAFSRGRGVDAVLITASTKSNQPVSQAAKMCRQRGRIVLVGMTGLELSRADFYEKELSFQVSCSYGPGRYDRTYEEGGQDYPVGFVRWTEQRNFEAVLDLMASKQLDVEPLISHRFPIQRAKDAYALLSSNVPFLGILLKYPGPDAQPMETLERTVSLSNLPATATPSVGFLGAGNYAGRVLIPAFKATGATLHTLVSAGGVSAVHHGHKHGFMRASTDAAAMLTDPAIDTIVVATQHDTHAQYVLQALRAGKHVFVEKPLCLTLQELTEIEAEIANHPALCLMVGFNRRFAPQVVRVKQLLAGIADPKCFVMTVNAGTIPAGHWTQDLSIGGGRIVGEGCHFVDLLRYLAGVPIVSYSAVFLGGNRRLAVTSDTATLTLEFVDGSIGTIHYFANGDKSFPKERLEVFCGRRILQLDNFRRLRGFGWSGFKKMNLWRQNKGNRECAAAFVESIRQGKPAPISAQELIETTRITFALMERNGTPVITV